MALSWQKPIAVGSLTVTLQKIEDSRCPKDVLCIWAGRAAADVQLQDSSGTSISKTLALGSMVTVPFGSKTYRVTLREVTPYPMISDLHPAEKEAFISVSVL
ncbi:hypothetical protein GCM10011405_23840 [Rufibacter glacialis]|nr:hypothetical protein GCM10011405_23840 [Rufibacter glacialis]